MKLFTFFCLTSVLAGSIATATETIFVAPTGDDTNTGDQDSPLRTISAAAERAMPGDTVLVLEGVYRERVTPARGGSEGKRIVYRAEPGKRVVIKGSDIWQPQWRSDGKGIFSAVPSDKMFDDRSPEYVDGHNPFRIQLASTPWEREGKREVERGYQGDPKITFTCGQVFVNGERYREVPLHEELTTKCWFFDESDGRIFVGFGDLAPDDQQVEIATRRRIFAPQQRGLGYITVEGFIMEHCGNQYPTNFWQINANAQKGALGIEAGHHWLIRRNVIRLAKTFAIDAGYVDKRSGDKFPVNDNVIEENYVVDNGSAGILSNRSERMIIRDNVITNNNTLRFFELKRWEQAGIKCHHIKDGHIFRNYIADNQLTYGVWLDNQFPDSRVSHNVIVNNDRAGVFLEMSDYGFNRALIDNNVIVGNHENSVYIHDASGATFAHNLFANTVPRGNRSQAVHIRQVSARTKTYHHSFFNNLFIGNRHWVDVNHPSHRSGPQRFENNVFDGNPDERRFVINHDSDKPAPWDDAQFVKMVSDELGEKSPGVNQLTSPLGAKMNAQLWQAFWNSHGLENSNESRFHPNSHVEYDAENQTLKVVVSYNPQETSSTKVAGLDTDLLGARINGRGDAVAGPFQNLKEGSNEFRVWSGLPVLKPGELPSVDFNQP